jgi:hypothetical protein
VDFVQAPHFLFATLPELKDATLLVEMETRSRRNPLRRLASTYGLLPERVATLQPALTLLADRACAGALAPDVASAD